MPFYFRDLHDPFRDLSGSPGAFQIGTGRLKGVSLCARFCRSGVRRLPPGMGPSQKLEQGWARFRWGSLSNPFWQDLELPAAVAQRVWDFESTEVFATVQ